MLIAIYDANVLYPSTLRDVLIRIGIARLAQPKWTEEILDEVFRNLQRNRPDLNPTNLQRTRSLMNSALRDATVSDYEYLIDQLDLPDANDRHVLAAAIHANAKVIVTKNLRDFPTRYLELWEIRAQHPDEFLTQLCQEHTETIIQIINAIARTWNAKTTPDDVLRRLSVDAPRSSHIVLQTLASRT